jgi:diaminopropionate ammonia-lyase
MLPACAPTSMAGLRCAEMSSLAWPILSEVARASVTVSDAEVDSTIARLAHPAAGDPVVTAGSSGAAGLAALRKLMRDPDLADLRSRLHLPDRPRAFAIVTEGPTAPEASDPRP